MKVTGLDKIGHKDLDEEYAKTLIAGLSVGTPENSPRFLEAARILGCTRAREFAGGRVMAAKK